MATTCYFLQHLIPSSANSMACGLYQVGIRNLNRYYYLICIWTLILQARRFASTIESIAKSLKDRSYLRPHKPYTPPEDAEKKLDGIFESQLGSNSAQLSNGRIKFKVLTACFKEFNHGVPNSKLHEILTTGKLETEIRLGFRHLTMFCFYLDDIRDFYLQEIDTRVPLDKFKSIELPPNVSIQYDYHRFHPDTDTMHGGISAFPRRSTIVTGLKYKKKYAGYNYKPIWHWMDITVQLL